MGQLKVSLQPCVKDIQVNYTGAMVDKVSTQSSLFNKSRLILYSLPLPGNSGKQLFLYYFKLTDYFT